MKGEPDMNFLNIGTYSPQQCGIATFSRNLRDNLTKLKEKMSIAAVSDPNFTYIYPLNLRSRDM
jgi:hypothetical protein